MAEPQTELPAGENACVSVTSQGREAFRMTQLFVHPPRAAGSMQLRSFTLGEAHANGPASQERNSRLALEQTARRRKLGGQP